MSAVLPDSTAELGRTTAARVLHTIAGGEGVITPAAVRDLVRTSAPLASEPTVDGAVAIVEAELAGLGPLQPLWDDQSITDVLVNGPDDVWVERSGTVQAVPVTITEHQIRVIVERVVGPLALTLDLLHPIVEGRLSGGGRITAVGPPVSPHGTILALRRLNISRFGLDHFARPAVQRVVSGIVAQHGNVVVFGPTGSGKSTLLATLVDLVADDERVVIVEDTLEIPVARRGVVRLESGPGQRTGSIESGFGDLVRVALRLRPDRIVVGEVRGPEALDLVWALTTGHRGSMATLHADGPTDALRRLEIFCSTAAPTLGIELIGRQVRAAVDVLIEVRRDPERGGRSIVGVWRTDNGRSLLRDEP